MQRVICVYLPLWPIDRIRRRLDRNKAGSQHAQHSHRDARGEPAIVLITTDRQREVIAACCEQSSACGVTIGMTLAHARALLQGTPIIERRFDPLSDERALHPLARWAIGFTPLVAPDPPDGLLMNITGCERLHRGETQLAHKMARALVRLGIHARIACASTIGCAWAAARFAHTPCIIDAGDERQFISTLPIEALRLDAATVTGLHEVGVERVEHLLGISRSQLVTRFGAPVLTRIDQALGERHETLNAITPHEPIIAERIFDGPVVDLEAIFITVRDLIHEVAGALAREEAGVTELALTLTRVDASPIHLKLRTSRPSRDAKHVWSLLQPRIEKVHLGYGVDSVTLRVAMSQHIAHEQLTAGASGGQKDEAVCRDGLDREAGQLIDTLAHRLGPQRALTMQVHESHQPQRVARYVNLLSDEAKPRRASQPLVASSDRPSQLLPTPEAIDVMAVAPEGPPVWMRWRGDEHRIINAIGPERLVEEWWFASDGDATGTVGGKDYFKVQIESGRWLWVFHQLESNRWFVHGAWT